MSHSYAQNHIHLVFSTKNREKITGQEFSTPLVGIHGGHLQKP